MYVKAGTYIGYAADLLKVIEYNLKVNPSFSADDQQLLLTYCRTNSENVHIDIDKKLFLTQVNPLFDATDTILKTIHNHQPCILHAPCVTNINKVLKQFGYTFTPTEENDINVYIRKALWNKCVNYSGMISYYIIVFIIVLFSIVVLMRQMNRVVGAI